MGWVTTEHPTPTELSACVQCGLCLPACPTFQVTGRETQSRRGRLQAMSAVADGLVEVDAAFASIIDSCLGCRACEPVCPGLVPFGRALEGAQAEVAAQLPSPSNRLRHLVVGQIVRRRQLVALGARMAGVLARMRVLPRHLRGQVSGLRAGSNTVGLRGYESSEGHPTVGLLAGCVQDALFGEVNRAAVVLLEMAGYAVSIPSDQTCCGALAAHDGQSDLARRCASSNVAAFEGCDAVVATAAGCSAHMVEYGHWADSGQTLAAKSSDITVVIAAAIADEQLPRLPANGIEVFVQDPCHLKNAQGIVAEPRTILEAGGYQLVETGDALNCCGAAGTFSLRQPEMAAILGESLSSRIRASKTKRVASANPGCEIQIRNHLGDAYQVAHPIEWYLQAVAAEGLVSNV